MNFKELIAVAGIGAMVATTSCTTTKGTFDTNRVPLSSLERIDVSSYVGNQSQIKSISDKYGLKIWQINDSNGNVAGYWSTGRMEGLHFRQLATDEKFITDTKFQGPRLPQGYTTKLLDQ